MRRVIKQFLYGFLYLSIFSGIIAVIYIGFLRPAPSCIDGKLNQGEIEIDCGGPNCSDCALRSLKPITGSVQFFGGDSDATAFIRIQNPNLNYGAGEFDYDIKLFNRTGDNFRTLSGKTFIYPSDVKAIILTSLDIDYSDIARAEFYADNFIWKKTSDFIKPDMDSREVSAKSSGNGIAVEGVVQNKNLFPISRVVVNAILINKQGLFINASKTFVADIKSREERYFKIFIPVAGDELQSVDFSGTKIYLEVIR